VIQRADERSLVESIPTGLFIDGKWREAEGGKRLDVEDPSTGETIASVADASVADGRAALDAAVAAQPAWAATPPRDRGEILRAAFEKVTERAEDLALLMTLEMGKPLAESRAEVAYGAEFFRWFSEEAVRVAGRWSTAPNGATRLMTMKQPVGPCLMITPWNFPLAMGTRKIGPAIAAGCTMVVKPASQTPLSMYALAQILVECGVPDGVLNVVTTSSTADVMEPLIRDPRLRKLTFTGSTPVGRALVEQSAQGLLRVSMELGGNAPFLVFDDADLDQAIEGAMIAKMRNGGEACTAANRFYVQRGIHDAFVAKLVERMGAMTLGAGIEGSTQCGAMINADAIAKIDRLVNDALAKGAEVKLGCKRPEGRGFFYPPSVIANVQPGSDLLSDEIFGPVAAVIPFDDPEEAIRLANATEFGLAAYVYSEDLKKALRIAERIECGMVAVNRGLVSDAAAPFGGVKQSGLGREGSHHGLLEYCEAKYIAVSW
jgi:succinate-semialdehyde dehydrogenase/glutarate-semialdehyde dehydrogenase